MATRRPRPTMTEQMIQNLDAKITAVHVAAAEQVRVLELAREHLVEELEHRKPAPK